MKTRRAFTLIELLIAGAIFSVIMLSLYSAFQSGILSYDKVDSAFSVYQQARITFNRIDADLRNVFIYSVNDSRFIGSAQSMEFYSSGRAFEAGNQYPVISRIKYDYSGNILKRVADAAGVESELSSDVRSANFTFAFFNNITNEYEWQESWPKPGDAQQIKALPEAVKIDLAIIERDRKNKDTGSIDFSKIIPLGVSGGENATSP